MLNFISRVLANLVSLAIFFVVIPALAILVVVAVLIVGLSGDQGQKMITPKDGVLVYDMSRGISEFKNSSDGLARLFSSSRAMSTYDLCMRLATAAKNKNIKAVLIYGSFDSASDYPSSAQVAELRNALLEYRQSGGKVTAYLENPSQLDYYLASCADNIIMNPFGEFTFRGLSLQMPFVGDAMKKYGVDVQVIKAGAHKSFGEMFTSAKMSDFDKTRMRAVIDSLWTNILAEISASRKIPTGTLERIVDTDAVFSARKAKELKLVDSLMYYDEVVEKMRKDYGEDGESFPQIPVARLSEVRAPSADEIAVVYMRSEIVESGKVSEFTSSEVYVPLLRSLRTDDFVKAVVLRIDSGGGSAYASEAIRREVELLAKKKPVIASFGGVAASGAYWIATAANKIIATPQTITGSIGVFSLAFSGQKFAGDWGVTFDGVKTSKFSDIGTLTRPMTEPEIAKMKVMVDDIYDAFI